MGNLAKQFGQNVRERRKARGMTQAQLAEATSTSEEWIRRIERGAGNPSFEVVEALATAMRCSAADLFTPLSDRAKLASKIDALLVNVPEPELKWVESLIRVALARPPS